MVDGIILAAGMSKRMGIDKMCLEISGRTILSRVLIEAVKSALNKIVVVTRYFINFNDFEEFPENYTLRLVNIVNTSPESGMSHSIKLGLAEIDVETDGVMIVLADQVCLNSSVINTLILASRQNPCKIITPTIEGRRTNPVIFPSKLFSELKQITGDKGGREVLASNCDMIKTLEFGKRYDDSDLDTPYDYSEFVSKLEKQLI